MQLQAPPSGSPVLVAVINDPADLARARTLGWYRIPLARAPRRIAAEHLAFYQTGSFPAEERWRVCWYAPVHGYRVVSRRDLLPEELTHPRADERYYRIDLGPLIRLPHPIPSRRLRRITFIATTLARLYEAEEINDLWIKSRGQEELWAALKEADQEAERQYPLAEDLPHYVADFAFLCRAGRIAVVVEDEPRCDDELREDAPTDYLLTAQGWTAVRVKQAELLAASRAWAARLSALVGHLGGIESAS